MDQIVAYRGWLHVVVLVVRNEVGGRLVRGLERWWVVGLGPSLAMTAVLGARAMELCVEVIYGSQSLGDDIFKSLYFDFFIRRSGRPQPHSISIARKLGPDRSRAMQDLLW
jgi:hypothetical protein